MGICTVNETMIANILDKNIYTFIVFILERVYLKKLVKKPLRNDSALVIQWIFAHDHYPKKKRK